jgi:N-acetylglucosamine-6-sulfatase
LKPTGGCRIVVAVRLGVFCLVLIGLASLASAPVAAAQPNIVLIVTDDQRWDTLRYMPIVQSELVGRGVKFTNGFVTNPLCCPSRVSILTGAYSHTTRVYKNGPPLGGFDTFRDESTVATWLDNVGYETALMGKYLNGYPGAYVPPGWDRWIALNPEGYYTYGFDIDGEEFPIAERSTYSTDFLAQEAVSFIRSAQRPFFLYFAPHAPHAPATPAVRHQTAFSDLPVWRPPSYNEEDVSDKPPWIRRRHLDRAERAELDAFRVTQLRSLLAVDDAVGSILLALSETGDLANTMVVFMSDNGMFWGEHRLLKKTHSYEESIRTPLVVRYDALINAARKDPRPVLGIDLAPTFAAVAGTTAEGSEGRSILPLLGGEEGVRWRKRFLVESLPRVAPPYCALRNPRYAFITNATGHLELYDLAFDPYQLQNLVGTASHARTIGRLRMQLARLCNPPPPGLNRRLLCMQTGTAGPDRIAGTLGYDILCGRGGDDRIRADGGPDYVYPGSGHDVVRGGSGNDHLFTRDGVRDRILCGSGRDRVLADWFDRVAFNCERVSRP